MILGRKLLGAKTNSLWRGFFPLPDCALHPKTNLDASLTHLPFLGVSSLMNWPCACKRRAAFFSRPADCDTKTGV
jgi:hypothetical protein